MADDDNNAAAPEDRDEMVVQFSDVTGVQADRSRFYLESANWKLQLALASFYEQDDNNPIDDVINMRMEEDNDDREQNPVGGGASASGGVSAASLAAAVASGGVGGASNNSRQQSTATSASGSRIAGLYGSAATSAGSAAGAKKKTTKYKPSASGARVATIHNIEPSSDDDDDDDEEQGQAFYTGTERSGQQILGPPRRKPPPGGGPAANGADFISEIFRSAVESGAEVVDPSQQQSGGGGGAVASGSSAFGGGGYRLGQTETDHVRLGGPPASGSASAGRASIEPVVLKLWRQGFSINDGELRSYEEPANKEFLESIMRGEIPAELRQQSGQMVHVDLEDHRHEDFKRTKATASRMRSFTDRGHTLGNPSPVTVVAAPEAAAAAATASADPAADQRAADVQLAVNADEPTTMIQVRLADGLRLSARFNHSHTVDDIRTYIATARTQYAGRNFALLTSYPSRELTDGAATISDAGLLNAALLQRLK